MNLRSKVSMKSVLLLLLLVVGAYAAYSYYYSAGGLSVPSTQSMTNYKCTVLLKNNFFDDVKINQATCGVTGRCFASYSAIGLQDEGNLQMTAGGKSKATTYALWETGEETYNLNVCGIANDQTAELLVLDDLGQVLERKEVPLL